MAARLNLFSVIVMKLSTFYYSIRISWSSCVCVFDPSINSHQENEIVLECKPGNLYYFATLLTQHFFAYVSSLCIYSSTAFCFSVNSMETWRHIQLSIYMLVGISSVLFFGNGSCAHSSSHSSEVSGP
jgi:hypothetical protein